jgi:flagellar biosynthesis regulator FlaF
LGLVLRQASAETPVPSRHECSGVNFTRKLWSLLVK